MTRSGDLSAFNTLGLESRADAVVVLDRVDRVEAVLEAAAGRGGPITWLGGGSNVVLAEHVPGTVCVVRLAGVEATATQRHVRFRVMAGENWHAFVRIALGHGVGGIENLALIPGAVGAAPIQNIGAYGAELAEFVVQVEVVDAGTGEARTLSAAECGFGYRDSRFKAERQLLITALTLELPRERTPDTSYPDIATALAGSAGALTRRALFEAVCRVRRAKLPHPRLHPNVGSFFKNPVVTLDCANRVREQIPGLRQFAAPDADPGAVKLPAAALIEACGWKGRVTRGVEVWRRQPLVLVNRTARTAATVLAVAAEVAASVEDRFGVVLEREPTVIG